MVYLIAGVGAAVVIMLLSALAVAVGLTMFANQLEGIEQDDDET